MAMTSEQQLLSAYESVCVTGVPLKMVLRIIDAGLLRDFAEKHEGKWMIFKRALVGLKLAHETADILTLKGRRWPAPFPRGRGRYWCTKARRPHRSICVLRYQ